MKGVIQNDHQKILVIQQKGIGDVLMASTLFKSLRQKFPHAELYYLVYPATVAVIENNPFIDEIILFTKEIRKSRCSFFRFLKYLRGQHFDIIIDAYRRLGSYLMVWFAHPRRSVGYKKWYNVCLYSDTIVPHRLQEHGCSLAFENRLKLLEPLGIPFQYLKPTIYLTEGEIDRAKRQLMEKGIDFHKPLLMLNIIGSQPEKTYPKSYMADLLDFCVAQMEEIQFIVNYKPKQRERVEEIVGLSKNTTQQHVYMDLYCTRLREFVALAYHCDGMFGNEGGGNNMGKAVGLKTFTIFSPFIRKAEWFGRSEEGEHVAIHLSDFQKFTPEDRKRAKKCPQDFYKQLTTNLIKPQLKEYLQRIDALCKEKESAS